MKKFIIALSALSMIATPALADGYRGEEYHEHRGLSTGGSVALGLGALILGGAIANRNRQPNYNSSYNYNPPYNYNNPYNYNQRQLVCENVYQRDYNGNYVLDQFGRAVFTQRCWYQ